MKRGAVVVMVILIAGGVLLRWWNVGARSLWFDEGYTQWVASLSAGQLVHMVRYDYTPPLYFLIAHWWTGAFGDSEFALRSWSALIASLTVVLVAMIAWRTTGNSWATALATALGAVSEIQVEWGQTARAYATAAFVFVLAAWLLIQYLDTGKKRWLALHALAAAALVYQHNIMWFFLAGLNLGGLIWPGRLTMRSRWISLAAADAAVIALFLPWLPGFLQQLHALERAYFTDRPAFWDFSHNFVAQAGINLERLRAFAGQYLYIADSGGRIFRLGFFAMGLGLCALAMTRQPGERRRRVLAILAFAIGPIVLGYVYSNVRTSVWIEKSFIPASTMLPIVLAAGLSAAWPLSVRMAGAAAMGILILAAGISSISFLVSPPREDWRSAVQWVAGQGTDECAVVFVSAEGEMLYRYYTDRLHLPKARAMGAPITYFQSDPPLTMTRVLAEGDMGDLERRLAEAKPNRITLVQAYTKWSDPKGIAQGYFDNNWKLVEVRDYGGVRARFYTVR